MKTARRRKTRATEIATKIRTYALTYEAGGQKDRAEGMRQAADLVDELAQRGDGAIEAPSSPAPAAEPHASSTLADLERRIVRLEMIWAKVPSGTPQPKPFHIVTELDPEAYVAPRRIPAILEKKREAPATVTLHKPLSPCDRAILVALAERVGPATRAYVAIVTGYSPGSGGVNAALARLRKSGWISGSEGALTITPAGRELARGLDGAQLLPTGPALLELWSSRLNPCAQILLQLGVQVHPDAIDRDRLSDSGYRPDSGGVNAAIATLRKLELFEARGPLRASATLMTALAFDPLSNPGAHA